MQRATARFGVAFLVGFIGVLAAAWAPDAAAQEPAGLRLGLPLDCDPGQNCWLVNYVDVDPSGGVRDYACGTATYDGHTGTDFAIPDLAAMARGVAVVASAPGVVAGVRDGMADEAVGKGDGGKVKGRECGNGVVLRHPGGWKTQYCHMRKDSIRVGKGQRVAAGDRLGLVGMSGRAEFPHVHFWVRHGSATVDPFRGLDPAAGCALGTLPLWTADALARLDYRPTALYKAGFAGLPPTPGAARSGAYNGAAIAATAPALTLWVDIFWVRAGDTVTLTITGPDGRMLVRTQSAIKKTQARRFVFAGKRRRNKPWPVGLYRGDVRLVRETGAGGREEYAITREVAVR